MREERIVIHPFEALKIEEYQGFEQINEHAYTKVAGQVPFDKKEEYMQLGRNHTWVRVAAVAQQRERILFYGVLESMREEIKGASCRMELVLKSGTVLMDYQEKMRSFQSESLTYGELLDICNEGYDSAAKTMTVAKEKTIDQFIMQYHETDWEFIKRLASMNHTAVIANCSAKGEKYYFGLPDSSDIITGDCVEYYTQCDIQEYWKKKGSGLSVTPADTMSYIWESREIYNLGDGGNIEGRGLFVWKIIREMKGNILYHTYYMQPKQTFRMPVQNNYRLSGASLFGIVKAVRGEKVQIEIFNDENKNKTGIRWFPYATVYSSGDGTGWYCMPEPGDKIRLYFPNEHDREAYAVSAYHEAGADLRKNHKCKFWRNREGKEIQLAPGRILLTNNNGTYIELSDADGIDIVSTGHVTLSAGETLRISSSGSSIEMSAPNKVRLKQGDTEMSLGGDLNMRGAQIKL